MLSFTEISNVWAVRLTDMSNICESLHHRNKEIAYGYLQAIAKKAGSQDSLFGMSGYTDSILPVERRTLSQSSVTCMELGKPVVSPSCIRVGKLIARKAERGAGKDCGESESFRVMRRIEV